MKVVVNFDLCESNAVCMGIAPEVFEVRDDDFLYVLNEEPGEELRDKVFVMVGGAPVSEAFAEEIESDAYGRDAAVAVDIAPAEIDPPLTVLQGLWGSLAVVDPRSAEAESVVARAVASPEVQDANDAVASWITANCSAN